MSKTLFYYATSNPHVTSPVVVTIEPTNICNLKCPFCPTGLGKNGRPKGMMTLERFKSVIDEIGDNAYFLNLVNYGEPLLNKSAYEMIAYAKRKNLYTLISSNLSFPLDTDESMHLVRSGLDHLVLSIDGATSETYRKYRIGGNFERVIKNLQQIIAAKKTLRSSTPFLEWQFIPFAHNEHEIPLANRLVKELGVNSISFLGAIVEDMGHRTGNNEAKEWFPSDQYKRRKEEKKCHWLWFNAVINWDGKVSPCCWAYYKKDDFGDIYKNEFSQIWNNEKFMKARKIFSEGPLYRSGTICDECVKARNWRDYLVKEGKC